MSARSMAEAAWRLMVAQTGGYGAIGADEQEWILEEERVIKASHRIRGCDSSCPPDCSGME